MGFSDGFIPFAVPSEGVFDYTLVSDGTTVTGYNNQGQAVSSGTDGGAVFTTVLGQLPTTGGAIGFRNDGNVFPWRSVPALPKSITRLLLLSGNGSTVQLTAAGPRFLDFNRTADYDTFQNITLDGFVVDGNNVQNGTANYHIFLGNLVGGGLSSRINFDNITVRNCRVINVPAPSAQSLQIIRFGLMHSTSNEGTQSTCTRILFDNCDFRGGNVGIAITGSVTTLTPGQGMNGLIDDIVLNNVRHDTGLVPDGTSTASNGNCQVGGYAQVGTITFRNFRGLNSGDVGIEIDNPNYASFIGCVIQDAWNVAYLPVAFRGAPNQNIQTFSFRDCHAKVVNINPPATSIFLGNSYGWFLNTNATGAGILGPVILDGCTYVNTAANMRTMGEAVCCPDLLSSRLIIRGCSFSHDTINDATGNAGTTTWSMIYYAPSSESTVITDGWRVSFGGTYTGAVETLRAVVFAGTGPLTLAVKEPWFTNSLTCVGSIVYLLWAGRIATVSGLNAHVIGRITGGGVKSWTGTASGNALGFPGNPGLTIDTDIRVTGWDNSQLPVGVADYIVGASTPDNRPLIFLDHLHWRVWPKLPAAMGATTFAAAAFTSGVGNQYIGGYPALIQMTGGTLVTSIDVSLDNATYYNIDTQAAGVLANTLVFYVDNGTYVKVTFAAGTQPATVVIPLK